MPTPQAQLSRLKRPPLLIRAARSGAADYARDRHLSWLLNDSAPRDPGAVLRDLMEAEDQAEDLRRRDCATYCLSRHISLLAAIIAEARLIG